MHTVQRDSCHASQCDCSSNETATTSPPSERHDLSGREAAHKGVRHNCNSTSTAACSSTLILPCATTQNTGQAYKQSSAVRQSKKKKGKDHPCVISSKACSTKVWTSTKTSKQHHLDRESNHQQPRSSCSWYARRVQVPLRLIQKASSQVDFEETVLEGSVAISLQLRSPNGVPGYHNSRRSLAKHVLAG